MTGRRPHFFIDEGGTFTDGVYWAPSGRVVSKKLLSSGILPGRITRIIGGREFFAEGFGGNAPDFWTGCVASIIRKCGLFECNVTGYDGAGIFLIDKDIPNDVEPGVGFEIDPEEHPAITLIECLLEPLEDFRCLRQKCGMRRRWARMHF